MDESVYNINLQYDQSIMNLFSPESRKQPVENEVNFVQYSESYSGIFLLKGGGGGSALLCRINPLKTKYLPTPAYNI